MDANKNKISRIRPRLVGFIFIFAIFYGILLITGYSYFKTNQKISLHKFTKFVKRKILVQDTDVLLSERKLKILTPTSNGTKIILLWQMPKTTSYPKYLDPHRCGKCEIITNQSKVSETDAVVFHFNKVSKPEDLPPASTRNQDQVYVWICRESPKTTKTNYKLDLTKLNNVFNWTMTHRRDSDVFFPYSEILHRNYDEKRVSTNKTEISNLEPAFVPMYYKSIEELLLKKQHLVAWVVGNCDATKGATARMKLVTMLMKAGLTVHRYGRCFKTAAFPAYRSEETHEKLSEYKFYLAFENTFGCRDYVTYKFWKNAIYSGAVPIVWGPKKSDLERLAPKNSFIHIEDFRSINHLIYYLKYLDYNVTAYREYFAWREHEISLNNIPKSKRVLSTPRSDRLFSLEEAFGYCKLCRMLHEKHDLSSTKQFKRKTILSLHNWWYESETQECLSNSI